MQVGLFICDHVKPQYRDQFGDYPDMFMRLFPGFDFKLYDVCSGQFPERLDECDLYMATGSSHSVYEDIDWIHQLKEVIREIYKQQKYFIGFCFGHQLMGEALGGKVEKSEKGWCVGVHEFKIQKQVLKNDKDLLLTKIQQISHFKTEVVEKKVQETFDAMMQKMAEIKALKERYMHMKKEEAMHTAVREVQHEIQLMKEKFYKDFKTWQLLFEGIMNQKPLLT